MLLNSAGKQKQSKCFERDPNTEASLSCSVNWKNQLFIFGGRKDDLQISRLTDHKLERVGDLTFKHYDGACSVMANTYIFLCFNNKSQDGKRCRRSTGPLKKFSEVALTNHKHRYIRTSCSDRKSKYREHSRDSYNFRILGQIRDQYLYFRTGQSRDS